MCLVLIYHVQVSFFEGIQDKESARISMWLQIFLSGLY
jgi:hypothetical protein